MIFQLRDFFRLFIDFSNDKRIKEYNYSDGDHLDNMSAPMTFTELVADTLPLFYSPHPIAGFSTVLFV